MSARVARPSDRSRVLDALRAAGAQGLHSHEIRRRRLTGHPSERAAELERMGYSIRRVREYRDKRNGTRFYLQGEPTVGVAADANPPRRGVSSHPGGADAQPPGTPDSKESGSDTNPAAPSACGDGSEDVGGASSEPARLFTPPPLNPLRDREAA